MAADAPWVPSRIEGGVIVPPTVLEVIVADHCNLACRQCNHGSPGVPKWLADPAEVGRDLAILAKVYRPRMIKMIGGEPLLHPDLAGLVAAIRASGIAPRIELVTNGTLIARMPEAVWAGVDKFVVSIYPGTAVEAMLPALHDKAKSHGTELAAWGFRDFRDTLSSRTNDDPDLVARIFAACKLANVWGVHGLYRGRIYRCPPSMYAPRLAGQVLDEGFPVEDTPDLKARLLAFLNGRTPLGSCRHCVGTSGKKAPHRFLGRASWKADLDRPPAEMIDPVLLAQSLEGIAFADDCAERVG